MVQFSEAVLRPTAKSVQPKGDKVRRLQVVNPSEEAVNWNLHQIEEAHATMSAGMELANIGGIAVEGKEKSDSSLTRCFERLVWIASSFGNYWILEFT